VYILYWWNHSRYRVQNVILLVSSYFFYGWWDWRFLSLILFSSIVDFILGIKISESESLKLKKLYLKLSLLANLGLLGFFKYFNFFIESFQDLLSTLGISIGTTSLNIILPVGISFYTFQTMSYTIDIYRGSFVPTKNKVAFFTYIAFFPQLVAGPIERASNLLPQIERKRKFDFDSFKSGLLQIVIGLFRKIVVADSLAVYVDMVYGSPNIYGSSTIILATFFYAFQIYFDFAGYSDIAIGTARLLGFRFNRNFNLPYFSKSITEFWRRWHMSLSFWLRDYLYISLGGNRKGIRITYRNLLITMILGGLWHGSSWNFVIWGLIHGVLLSLEKYIKSLGFGFERIKIVGYFYTFSAVLLSWIFFRSTSLSDAMIMFDSVFSLSYSNFYVGDFNVFVKILFVLSIGILIDLYLFRQNFNLEELGSKLSNFSLIVLMSISIILIVLLYSSSNNFNSFKAEA